MTIEEAKQAAGRKGAEFVTSGMIVGLGTGTTSDYFIHALSERCAKEGLFIQCVASSEASAKIAHLKKLPLLSINSAPRIDLTVDGADEIDPKNRMIKGGGGAHVREKILAYASKEVIIVVDETKLVSTLGQANLPVEVLPYGAPITQKHLENLGFSGQWRLAPNRAISLNQEKEDLISWVKTDAIPYITENGNFIFDISFKKPPQDPLEAHWKILQIPGVVDTGFFFDLVDRVIIGHPDGTTTMSLSAI